MEANCQHCVYAATSDAPEQVYCRRVPPTPILNPADNIVRSFFPQMMYFGWCGEFRAGYVIEVLPAPKKKELYAAPSSVVSFPGKKD